MKKAYAFAADGTEESELLCVVDALKRAGMEVKIISVCGEIFTSSHGVRIIADGVITGSETDADLIFVPGGMPGSATLGSNETLVSLIKTQLENGKRVAAICAAPAVVLGAHGFLRGKRATCFSGFENDTADFTGERVVTDGLVTTAKGLGTALELGIELVRLLVGDEKAKEIAEKIVLM